MSKCKHQHKSNTYVYIRRDCPDHGRVCDTHSNGLTHVSKYQCLECEWFTFKGSGYDWDREYKTSDGWFEDLEYGKKSPVPFVISAPDHRI